MMKSPPAIRNFFVDEAGCTTLFGRRGTVAIGSQGCSNFFIMGFIEVFEPLALSQALDSLRNELLADPYFKSVPSMQPVSGKTARAFHAKDDISEIRREVFKTIMEFDFIFHAEIRNKSSLLNSILDRQSSDTNFKYDSNYLYDSLASRLFKNHLHKGEHINVCFAKRGNKPRTEAFKSSLARSRQRFRATWGIESDVPIAVTCSTPELDQCLQAADYCLWALQRHYERGEPRYIEYIWDKVGCIHDIDDTRKRPAGEYYTKKKPLIERL